MIQIEDLYKYYGERKALGPVRCEIADGEIVGLLGLNGAGKTTTLRILACDLLPSSGRVVVDGFDVVDYPHDVRARIGYLPDTPPLYTEMTVREYLAFAARLRGLGGKDVATGVDLALERTELGRVRNDVISSLSHGYKQRVGIAQAIVHRPKLLVLDEPITGLDPVQIVEMRELLKSLGGEHTIVLSSHILSEISETCDRILVIADGRIAAAGTEAELQAKLAGATTTRFTVRGAESDAREAIEAIDGVSRVDRVPVSELGENVTSLVVESTKDVREAACAALVKAGIGLLEVKAERELESVFMRLAGPNDNASADAEKEAAA